MAAERKLKEAAARLQGKLGISVHGVRAQRLVDGALMFCLQKDENGWDDLTPGPFGAVCTKDGVWIMDGAGKRVLTVEGRGIESFSKAVILAVRVVMALNGVTVAEVAQ